MSVKLLSVVSSTSTSALVILCMHASGCNKESGGRSFTQCGIARKLKRNFFYIATRAFSSLSQPVWIIAIQISSRKPSPVLFFLCPEG